MSCEDNKAQVRRFVEATQVRDEPDAVERFLAPGFVDHAAPPGLPPTREGVRQLFAAMRRAFPDLRAEIHDQIAEGDRVATRKTLRGTHLGAWMGIAATGRAVAFEVMDVLRLEDGWIVEHWNLIDLHGLLAQLGERGAG